MPREIDIELTAKCNLRCKYCYFFENENLDYIDLSTQEWIRFFDELGSIGVMKVTLAGGEPFYRNDLIEISTVRTQSPACILRTKLLSTWLSYCSPR